MHLSSYSAFLTIALVLAISSVIKYWIELPKQPDIPISVVWTVFLVGDWLLLLLATLKFVSVSCHMIKNRRNITKSKNEGRGDSFRKITSGDMIQSKATFIQDFSWVYSESDTSDGCGCSCCSRTGIFRLNRYFLLCSISSLVAVIALKTSRLY